MRCERKVYFMNNNNKHDEQNFNQAVHEFKAMMDEDGAYLEFKNYIGTLLDQIIVNDVCEKDKKDALIEMTGALIIAASAAGVDVRGMIKQYISKIVGDTFADMKITF